MKSTSKIIKLLIAVIIPFISACSLIEDSLDDCGIYLEFIYEYNMKFSDTFDPEVGVVDIFVFDADGKYLFAKRSEREELIGGKRMFLGKDIPFGQYKVLTVGGLSEYFSVLGRDGNVLSPGTTTLDDVRVALKRSSGVYSNEFEHMWIGETITIDYRADLSVWPVRLIKNTNKFNIYLKKTEGDETAPEVNYTFEIVTPEGGVYGHDNSPKVMETVTYTPYYLGPGTEEGVLLHGRINTMRLFYEQNYKLVVRNARTGDLVWEYDLMPLLEETKPANPPGMQEYLDRQSEWDLTIIYKGDGLSFTAIGVIVNDWLIWLQDIDV